MGKSTTGKELFHKRRFGKVLGRKTVLRRALHKRIISKLFSWLTDELPCPRCGSHHREEHGEIHLDYGGPLLEYAVRCTDCKAGINYWAYGSWEGPNTYSELIWYKFWRALARLKRVTGYKGA